MGADRIVSVVAVIDRDATVKLPVTVFEYELPVLEAIHGEESVSVHSSKEVRIPDGFNAAEAYNALLRKYPQHHDAVRSVYPRAATLARSAGLSYAQGDDEAAKGEQASIITRDGEQEPTDEAAGKKGKG